MATIPAGQTLSVPLRFEGILPADISLNASFHVVNVADNVLQGGFGHPIAEDDFAALDAGDSVLLKVVPVDLTLYDDGTPMPETYEDTLPSVVPMNRDYDMEYVNAQGQPVPDCTDPIPAGATPPPQAYGIEDDLVSAVLTLPNFAYGTWTLTIPGEFRVWQQLPCEWAEVESDEPYIISSGGTITLRVEGLQPSATPDNFIVVSCQQTDASGSPLGLPISDKVKVEVVSIDLEVDYISEYDEATWAASILVNDDYDEGNLLVYTPPNVVSVSDNGRSHGYKVAYPPVILPGDDDLCAASLTIDGPNGQHGIYWIEVVGEPEYAQNLLVWKAEGEEVVELTLIPRDRASALPATLDANAVDLIIEGLSEVRRRAAPDSPDRPFRAGRRLRSGGRRNGRHR